MLLIVPLDILYANHGTEQTVYSVRPRAEIESSRGARWLASRQ